MKYLKIIMAVICCLIGLRIQAQDYGIGKQKIGRPSRWAVGIMGSPDFQGHLMVPTNNDNGPEAASLLRQAEKPGFGFTTGIHVMYDLKSRWFMRLGIYYSDKAVNEDGFVTGIQNTPGFVKINSGGGKAPFAFIEIPLTFHYYLNTPFEKNKNGLCFNDFTQHNQGKPLFYVFAGPALSINLARHTYHTRQWSSYTDTLFINSLPVYADPMTVYYFGAYAGIGVLKYFGQHFFASAEITARYFPFQWYGKKLSGNESNDPGLVEQPVLTYPVKDQPYSIGLQLAINYHF